MREAILPILNSRQELNEQHCNWQQKPRPQRGHGNQMTSHTHTGDPRAQHLGEDTTAFGRHGLVSFSELLSFVCAAAAVPLADLRSLDCRA